MVFNSIKRMNTESFVSLKIKISGTNSINVILRDLMFFAMQQMLFGTWNFIQTTK